jgi:glycyl-tRNA synthetase alpha subunit
MTVVAPLLPCCRYSDEVTYGELFLQNEYEMSCYNLDEADVAEQRKRFNLYEAEVSQRGRHRVVRGGVCMGRAGVQAHFLPGQGMP